jgi:hypothetical protein
MARLALLVLAVSGMVLASTAALSAIRLTAQGPVYRVAELRRHLDREPQAWVGRVLLVRGEVVPCMAVPSVGERPCAALVSGPGQPSGAAPRGAAGDPLTLVRGEQPPGPALLRSLPLLGSLLPAPQSLHWGAVATYRVQLQAVAASSCGTGKCFEALLDTAPGSP